MRVLVIDDDPPMRDLLLATIAARGHEVVGVGDGEAAWAAIAGDPRPLVVLDWLMPVLDGHALCRRIRASPVTTNTFVLMVTVRDGSEDLVTALDAGADDYLQKPFTPMQLTTRLQIAERRIAVDVARRRSEADLAHAQWLAGIGQMALAVQHEINNPLAALLGSAALLSDGQVPIEDAPPIVETIVNQARRIGDVVRQLAALDDPRTVDYLKGRPMIDLAPARGRGQSE
jgi:CheY-like chemotaxis protein